MISREQALLQMRVDELERRLARLEEGLGRPTPVAPEATAPVAPVAMTPVAPVAPEAMPVAEPDTGVDAGREGAQLVALEMLTEGYEPQQVSTYLRETFRVHDADAVIAEAGAASG